MSTFRVKVWHGVTEHQVTVRARCQDEAMGQALLVLKLAYQDVRMMEATKK